MRPRHEHKTTRIFTTVPKTIIEAWDTVGYLYVFGILIENLPNTKTSLRRIKSRQAERPTIYVGSYAEATAVLGSLYLAESLGLLKRSLSTWEATPISVRPNASLFEFIEKTVRWTQTLTVSSHGYYLPKENVFLLEYAWDDRKASAWVYVTASKTAKTFSNYVYDFKIGDIPTLSDAEKWEIRITKDKDDVLVEGVIPSKRVRYSKETLLGFIADRCLESVK